MQRAQAFLIISRHSDECARADSYEVEQIDHSHWEKGKHNPQDFRSQIALRDQVRTVFFLDKAALVVTTVAVMELC